jgi:hypothetical protein
MIQRFGRIRCTGATGLRQIFRSEDRAALPGVGPQSNIATAKKGEHMLQSRPAPGTLDCSQGAGRPP